MSLTQYNVLNISQTARKYLSFQPTNFTCEKTVKLSGEARENGAWQDKPFWGKTITSQRITGIKTFKNSLSNVIIFRWMLPTGKKQA